MSSDPNSANLRMAFVGDLALAGNFVHGHRPTGAHLSYPFSEVEDHFRDVDILFVNLEGPLSTDGEPLEGKTSLLHNEPAVIDWLCKFPLCVCSLANNHILDFGVFGLNQTIGMLRERGVSFVGAGPNEEEARQPLILTVKGIRVGVLAFTTDEAHVGSVIAEGSRAGCAGMPEEEIAAEQVVNLTEKTDFVIVLLHMGHEYYHYPTPRQIWLKRKLIKAGARLVIGHHPHVQQGVEVHEGGLICYSLGNFFFPEMVGQNGILQFRKPITRQFSVLHVNTTKERTLDWHIEGGRRDNDFRLRFYSGSKKDRFAHHIDKLSEPLKESDYAQFWIRYCRKRRRELKLERLPDAIRKLRLGDFALLKRFPSVMASRFIGRHAKS